jgi:uncharacterized membrane protein
MCRFAVVLVFLFLLTVPIAACLPEEYASLTVLEGGLVRVDYLLSVNATSIVDVSLIGAPISELGVIVVDEAGNPLAYDINESSNTMSIVALNCSEIKISYYTQSIITFSRGVWSLEYSSPTKSIVRLPRGSTIVSMSTVPALISTSDSLLVLEFPRGRVALSFAYLPPSAPQQKPQAPSQPSPPTSKTPTRQNETSASRSGPTSQGTPSSLDIGTISIILIAGLLGLVAASYLIKRRRGALSEEDREIVDLLRRAGGGMFQSDIGLYVKMPTTTLWRRVRRLQELGYVRVEKVGGRNYVRLLKS